MVDVLLFKKLTDQEEKKAAEVEVEDVVMNHQEPESKEALFVADVKIV